MLAANGNEVRIPPVGVEAKFPGSVAGIDCFGTIYGAVGLVSMMFPNRISNARISGRVRSAAISARTALLAVLAVIPTAHPTFPQTGDKAPSADCQTGPATPETEQSEEWTRKLERCAGVLLPPKTGDRELVEPAPPTGKTRIIKPHELPPDEGADEGIEQ